MLRRIKTEWLGQCVVELTSGFERPAGSANIEKLLLAYLKNWIEPRDISRYLWEKIDYEVQCGDNFEIFDT